MGDRGGHHHKRRRDEEQPLSPSKQLLASLIQLGDDALPGLAVDEDTLAGLVKAIRREARNSEPEVVAGMLLDCAVQLPTKTPVYALVIGLLNLDDPELVGVLVQRAHADLHACMSPAGLDARRARLVLRLLCALVVTNVLQPSDVLGALRALVDAAAKLAERGAAPGGDASGASWQPYADFLASSALCALPWGGPELAEGAPGPLAALLEAAGAYEEARPERTSAELRPFSAGVKPDDPLETADCGAASFLADALAAVREAGAGGGWQLESVPRPHLRLEARLAEGTPQALPPLAPPPEPPMELPPDAHPSLAAALMRAAFPARGSLPLLGAAATGGGRPALESLVASDYVLDTVAYFEADRVECAKRLAAALPLGLPHEAVLCEALFGQMLRLPGPELRPVAYSTLMVDLCKLLRAFPRAMSGCVRELFARMNAMDPALRLRVAEWLAYHLSAFDYVWPWPKWEHVLEAPAWDGQRRFCQAVLSRLVRLSYWDRVQGTLPEPFQALMPPKPEPAPLPDPGGSEGEADEEGRWAARMLKLVREKTTAEALDAWAAEQGLESALGGPAGALRAWARCLLVAGAKSYSHMVVALERYYGPLAALHQRAGREGEAALVDVAAAVWAAAPQRAAMAVDRLMTLRLVSAEAIVEWVFSSGAARAVGEELRCGLGWELLHNAVGRAVARVQDAHSEVRAAEAAPADEAAGEEQERALAEKRDYLAESQQAQQAAVLRALRCLADELRSGGSDSADGGPTPMEGAGQDEGGARRQYMLACLRSFARQYTLQVAEVAGEVESELLAPPDVDAEAKAVLREQLRLQ